MDPYPFYPWIIQITPLVSPCLGQMDCPGQNESLSFLFDDSNLTPEIEFELLGLL